MSKASKQAGGALGGVLNADLMREILGNAIGNLLSDGAQQMGGGRQGGGDAGDATRDPAVPVPRDPAGAVLAALGTGDAPAGAAVEIAALIAATDLDLTALLGGVEALERGGLVRLVEREQGDGKRVVLTRAGRDARAALRGRHEAPNAHDGP